MKKLIFILFFVSFNFSAQDVQNRILLIKKMYKETNRLMHKENTICKFIRRDLYDDYDKEMKVGEWEIEYCDLDNGYSKITIEIHKPYSFTNEEHYFRYNNLFFSYISYAEEQVEVKYIHYFNSSGELIRNLIDDGSGNENFSEGPYLAGLYYAIDTLLNDKNE